MHGHFVQNTSIVIRVADHGDGIVVLGSGTQHGGTADIDVLDGVHKGDVRGGDGLLELVEVDADQVDHLDTVLSGLRHVLLGVATAQQAAMHLGVQRLNTPVHHLGEARELLDGDHRNAGLFQHARGTARRDDLNTVVAYQRLSELDDTRLVGHRDQRARDLLVCAHAALLLRGCERPAMQGGRPLSSSY